MRYEVMQPVKLSVQLRKETGKNANNRLRAAKMVPAVLYGKKEPAISLQLNPRDLLKVMDPAKKRNTFFELEMEGGSRVTAFIRDVQFDTLTGNILHVDFLRTEAQDMVPAMVAFRTTGRPEGVKLGGQMRLTMTQLPVTCPAAEVPSVIEQDVTAMGMGAVLRVEDLKLPENLKVRLSPRQALVIVSGEKEEKSKEEAPAAEASPASAAPAAAAAPAKPAKK